MFRFLNTFDPYNKLKLTKNQIFGKTTIVKGTGYIWGTVSQCGNFRDCLANLNGYPKLI